MNSLIVQLFGLQVLLPLGLIALNALAASPSRLALGLRATAVGLLLIYAALAGIWLFPPWWTPYLLLVVHVLGCVHAYRRFAAGGYRTSRLRRRIETGLGAVALLAVIASLLPVIKGRLPSDIAIDLAMPLGPGRYLVTSGGSTQAINSHFMTLRGERAAPYRGQSYGVDIIAIDWLGLRADGLGPRDPQAYHIYGTGILAPCTGVVESVSDGHPDNPVPDMDRSNFAGNHVLLGCSGLFVLLAHMAPGSVAVQAGDPVTAGQRLGAVGNSGNSAEPHLHIHVQEGTRPDAPISGTPRWFTIEGRFPVRNTRFRVDDTAAPTTP